MSRRPACPPDRTLPHLALTEKGAPRRACRGRCSSRGGLRIECGLHARAVCLPVARGLARVAAPAGGVRAHRGLQGHVPPRAGNDVARLAPGGALPAGRLLERRSAGQSAPRRGPRSVQAPRRRAPVRPCVRAGRAVGHGAHGTPRRGRDRQVDRRVRRPRLHARRAYRRALHVHEDAPSLGARRRRARYGESRRHPTRRVARPQPPGAGDAPREPQGQRGTRRLRPGRARLARSSRSSPRTRSQLGSRALAREAAARRPRRWLLQRGAVRSADGRHPTGRPPRPHQPPPGARPARDQLAADRPARDLQQR